MKPSNNLENKTPSLPQILIEEFCRTTSRIQSGPDAFDKSRFVMTILTILGVIEVLYSFRLVLEEKTGKEIPELSRLEFLEKFSANNFASSYAEDNTSGPLNRGNISELLLLRTLLAIHQKSREASFWELMNSFVLLVYTSLGAAKINCLQELAGHFRSMLSPDAQNRAFAKNGSCIQNLDTTLSVSTLKSMALGPLGNYLYFFT